jgi:hypothetical protein
VCRAYLFQGLDANIRVNLCSATSLRLPVNTGINDCLQNRPFHIFSYRTICSIFALSICSYIDSGAETTRKNDWPGAGIKQGAFISYAIKKVKIKQSLPWLQLHFYHRTQDRPRYSRLISNKGLPLHQTETYSTLQEAGIAPPIPQDTPRT